MLIAWLIACVTEKRTFRDGIFETRTTTTNDSSRRFTSPPPTGPDAGPAVSLQLKLYGANPLERVVRTRNPVAGAFLKVGFSPVRRLLLVRGLFFAHTGPDLRRNTNSCVYTLISPCGSLCLGVYYRQRRRPNTVPLLEGHFSPRVGVQANHR